ncbi:MAG TPA: hypothetical protein VGM50_07075 [Gemmatimonadaceae bacterium]|jgi:hypothetical protein
MRALFTATALCIAAHSASAQQNAIDAAKHARDAENAHVAAEQRVDAPAPQAKKSSDAQTAAKPAAKAAAPARPGTQLTVAQKDTIVVPPTIMREQYDYTRDGRRDPFVSLLTTNELRPTMSDLMLTAVLLDHAGSRSVATLRDQTDNKQYRVTTGSALGRMRVTAIKNNTVIFTIEEFGSTRQDSLLLHDPTKARTR